MAGLLGTRRDRRLARRLKVGLVTAAAARDHDDDLGPLRAALEALGAPTAVVDWHDPDVDWSSFAVAVIRSPWDYFLDCARFVAWAECVASVTRLENPSHVVRWNSDKRYLADLARAGVPVVSTRFVAPGGTIDLGPRGDVVVKPVVSAGSNDTRRHRPGEHRAARAHVEALLAAGRAAMVQPYVDAIDAVGETGVVFVDGVFSHAFRKGPILGGERVPFVAGLYAEEDIGPRIPTAAELGVATGALAAVPHRHPLLYARVDLVPGPSGPLVLELELIEPSLFLAQDAGSAARLARAIMRVAELDAGNAPRRA